MPTAENLHPSPPRAEPLVWRPPEGVQIHITRLGLSASKDRSGEASGAMGARIVTHFTAAVDQALANLPRHLPMGCVVGVTEPRPGGPSDLHGCLIGTLDEQRPDAMINALLLPRGHASGLMALQFAAQQLALGEAELCLVGGVDSLIDAPPAASSQARPDVGEAAGACLLATAPALARHRLRSMGRVLAAVTTRCPPPLDADAIDAAWTASAQALQRGEAAPGASTAEVHVSWPGMPQPLRRVPRLQQLIDEPLHTPLQPCLVSSPADRWGDCGAASGLLMLHQALAARAHDVAHPSTGWHWLCAHSASGHNTVLLVESGPSTGCSGAPLHG